MKAKALFALSAIGILGLVSCGNDVASSSIEPNPDQTVSSSVVEPDPVKRFKIVDSLDDHVSLVGLPSEAEAGEKITFKIALDPGYEFLDQVVAKTGDTPIDLSLGEDGTYAFTMPEGEVTIVASDQISSFELDYELSPNVGLKAYRRVKNADLVQEAFQKVAGVYEGVYYGGDEQDEGYRYHFDAMGNVKVAQHYTEPWKDYLFGDIRYSGKGTYEAKIDESDPNLVHVAFALTEFEGASGYLLEIKGELDIALSPKEDPAALPNATLSGKLTETSSSYPRIKVWDTPVGGHEFTRKETIESNLEGHTYFVLDRLPTQLDYLSKIYYQATITDEKTIDALTANGKALSKNADGYYEYDVPYRKTLIALTEKDRYAPIAIESNHQALSAKAYVREEKLDPTGAPEVDADGKKIYVYEEVSEAKYKQEIFLKIFAPEDGSVALSFLSVKYGSGSGEQTDSGVNVSSFTQNEDGYLASSRYFKMDDMDFGLSIKLTSISSWLEPSDEKIVTGLGTKLDEKGTSVNFSANDKGQVSWQESSTAKSEYYYKASDVGAETISLHKLSDSNKEKAYPAYFHNGLYLINSTGNKNVHDFVLAGGDLENGTQAVEFAYEAENFAVVSAKKNGAYVHAAIGDFDEATGIDEATGVDHDALTVKWDVVLHNYSSATPSDSIWETEGVFDVVHGQEVLGTYSRAGRVLTPFEKGIAGTFAGEAGTLVTDGVGKVTLNGATPYIVTNGKDEAGKPIVSLLMKDDSSSSLTLYSIALDDANKQYGKIQGKPFATTLEKRYYGAKIDGGTPPKASSYFKFGIGTDKVGGQFLPGKGFWEGSSYDYRLEADGSLHLGGKKVTVSPEGKAVYVKDESSSYGASYLLSSTLTKNTSNAQKLAVAEIEPRLYLAELIASSPENGEDSNVQLILGTEGGKPVFRAWSKVTLLPGDAKKWNQEGAQITYVKEDGTTSATLSVASGKLVENVDGVYQIDGKTYAIEGSKVTVDGKAYQASRAGNVFTYEVIATDQAGGIGKSTCTLTVVDASAKQATFVQGEPVLIGEAKADFDLLYDVAEYGFQVTGAGAYQSTNANRGGTVSSLEIHAKKTGELTFAWDVSCESTYDYFYVQINGVDAPGYGSSNKSEHSGIKNGTATLAVNEGDVVTICYKKDGSGDNNEDRLIVSNFAIA